MHLEPVSHARARQGASRGIDASCLDGGMDHADPSRMAVSLQRGPRRHWLGPGTACLLRDLLQRIRHSLRRPVTSTAASDVTLASDSTRPDPFAKLSIAASMRMRRCHSAG